VPVSTGHFSSNRCADMSRRSSGSAGVPALLSSEFLSASGRPLSDCNEYLGLGKRCCRQNSGACDLRTGLTPASTFGHHMRRNGQTVSANLSSTQGSAPGRELRSLCDPVPASEWRSRALLRIRLHRHGCMVFRHRCGSGAPGGRRRQNEGGTFVPPSLGSIGRGREALGRRLCESTRHDAKAEWVHGVASGACLGMRVGERDDNGASVRHLWRWRSSLPGYEPEPT
jgi:hypothetical protein